MGMDVLHRKEQLIITAIEIIDEVGIQKLSTREIARRQGVSEATLFRHYKSKNDLLIAVLDYFSQFDDDIFQSIRLKKLKPKDAITYLITTYVEYYENYPAITSILQLVDYLRFEAELSDSIKTIQNKRTCFLKQLIEDAKKGNEIRADADSENLSDLIFGFLREMCLKWRLSDREFSLSTKTTETLKMLLDALANV